jgi:hypothetical protein
VFLYLREISSVGIHSGIVYGGDCPLRCVAFAFYLVWTIKTCWPWDLWHRKTLEGKVHPITGHEGLEGE